MFVFLMKGALLVCVIFFVFIAIGLAGLRLISPPVKVLGDYWNPFSILFFASALGGSVYTLGLWFLGIFCGYGYSGFIWLTIILVVPSVIYIFRTEGLRSVGKVKSLSHVGTVAALLVMVIVSSCHPSGDWDDTMYHLPLARSYLANHGIAIEQFLRFPLFPQNMNLLMGLGLFFADEFGAQVLVTLPLALISLGLLGVSKGLSGSYMLGAVASVLVVISGPVSQTLGYAYVDNGLSFYCFSSAIACVFWAQSSAAGSRVAPRWLIISGASAGISAGVKYFGLVYSGMVGIYILMGRGGWRLILYYCISLLIFGGWWYARSYLISGDPVHPAGAGIFGYYLWDAEDLLLQREEQATHGVPPDSLNMIGALQVAGVPMLAIALASPILRNPPLMLCCFRVVFFLYLGFWFFVSQVARYIMPILPVGAIIVAYMMYVMVWCKLRRYSWVSGGAERVAVLFSGLLFLFVLVYVADKAVFRKESWVKRLGEIDGYSLMQKANQSSVKYGSRLIQLGFENSIYFFKGTVIGDHFGPGRYRSWIDCDAFGCSLKNVSSAAEKMEAFGAKMLLINKKRYAVDMLEYQSKFNVLAMDDGGVLMALKP